MSIARVCTTRFTWKIPAALLTMIVIASPTLTRAEDAARTYAINLSQTVHLGDKYNLHCTIRESARTQRDVAGKKPVDQPRQKSVALEGVI